MEQTITTADGIVIREGSKAFNHYDMRVGCIGVIDRHPQPDTMKGQTCSTPVEEWDNYWFEFIEADGCSTSLDGSRICSIEYAKSRGWI